MCGRYALNTPPEVLAELLKLSRVLFAFGTRYNVAPTQVAPVVRLSDGGQRELVGMHWGLIPSWAKDRKIASRLINARSETVAKQPAFRAAFKRRRCIVPASGFYEWRKLDARTKQPYYVYRADEQPLLMAGLWEQWRDTEHGHDVESFAVLTTNANDQVRLLHDRMPVILEPEQVDVWLNLHQDDVGALGTVMQPAAAGVLSMHPVSKRVNSPRNDDPSLIEPVKPTQGNTDSLPSEGQQGLFS